jgi:hypothetical protein
MRKVFLMFLIVMFCSLTACESIPQKRESIFDGAQLYRFIPDENGIIHVIFLGPEKSVREAKQFVSDVYAKTPGKKPYIFYDQEAESLTGIVFISFLRKNAGNSLGESVQVIRMRDIMVANGTKKLHIDVYGTDMAAEMVNALESIHEAKLPAGTLKATTITFHETEFKKARAAELLSSLK